MTSLTRPPVSQTTFPEQVAAPPGQVDVTGMYLMHHAFRRDLRAFAAALTRTPVADRTTWRALAARWKVFADMLHSHHTGEDAILWPLLLARVDEAGDQAGQTTLHDMEAEHAEIDPLLAGCHAGFARLADAADADALAALQVRIAALRERLHAHLGHEETDAMALVQRHVTAAEWHALDRQFAKHYPKDVVRYGLPWVLHGIPQDLMPTVRTMIGPVLLVLWRLLLRRGFTRRERVAFRYA